jgi:hypothetical protein
MPARPVTFCSVRMLSICPTTPPMPFSSSRFSSGVPTFTAMTTSAPMARAASTGRLLVSMPSTSIMPSNSAGATAPGTAMLARMTLASSPSLNTTALPCHQIGRHGAVGNRQLVEVLVALDLGQLA